MTLPYQRALALEGGYELILKVLGDPTAPEELKSLARWAHRHYPTPHEIQHEARRQAYMNSGKQVFLPGPWIEPKP
jgi:hypothetical protein